MLVFLGLKWCDFKFFQDNISGNNSGAIRDFSAKCIKEFLHWTLKDDDSHIKPSLCLRIIINKIEQFCIHSDLNKQIGKFDFSFSYKYFSC